MKRSNAHPTPAELKEWKQNYSGYKRPSSPPCPTFVGELLWSLGVVIGLPAFCLALYLAVFAV
jgi:hypothetical protein